MGSLDTFNLILLHHDQTTTRTGETGSDAKSDESDIREARRKQQTNLVAANGFCNARTRVAFVVVVVVLSSYKLTHKSPSWLLITDSSVGARG